ncbi:hypothetical protein CPB85DRAFT_1258907 [Mucidula mucida]|nr:hypothetical protein CPB85DRAFT_1258907 [Mucidula mucida]
MKDAFFNELLAHLDTPERSFEYTPSFTLAISASNERPTSEELRAARHAIESASADRDQYAGLIYGLKAYLNKLAKDLHRLTATLKLIQVFWPPFVVFLQNFSSKFSASRSSRSKDTGLTLRPIIAGHGFYRTWKDVVLHLDRSLALSLLQAQNKLDNLHRVSFIEALGSAVMLERLTVRCCTWDEIIYNGTETACVALLPALRYMTTGYPQLFAVLHLPAVEELVCHQSLTIENHPECIWDMFCQGRSAFASLTSLSIFDNRTMPKYMLLVLQTLWSLERLEIEVTQALRETYLDPLLLRLRSQPHLLPRLCAITFKELYDTGRGCQCYNLETSKRLLDIVHERQGVLETVHLELNHRIVFLAEDRQRLQDLQRHGLDFEASKSRPPKDDDESEGEEESLASVTGSDDSDSEDSE